MAIYTFSTKGTKPVDTDLVDEVRAHCAAKNMNFSALVVSLLKTWHSTNIANKESADDKRK